MSHGRDDKYRLLSNVDGEDQGVKKESGNALIGLFSSLGSPRKYREQTKAAEDRSSVVILPTTVSAPAVTSAVPPHIAVPTSSPSLSSSTGSPRKFTLNSLSNSGKNSTKSQADDVFNPRTSKP